MQQLFYKIIFKLDKYTSLGLKTTIPALTPQQRKPFLQSNNVKNCSPLSTSYQVLYSTCHALQVSITQELSTQGTRVPVTQELSNQGTRVPVTQELSARGPGPMSG